MTVPGFPIKPPADYERRIADLEARLRALEQKPNTGLGRMSVLDPDGTAAIFVGPDPDGDVRPDGQPAWVTRMQRNGGQLMFKTNNTSGTVDGSYRQYWAWIDSEGTTVLSDDAKTGKGLARPWIPVVMQPKFNNAAATWSYMTISNSLTHVEQQIWEGFIPLVTHPYFGIAVVAGIASGTSGTPSYNLYIGDQVTPIDSWSSAGIASLTRTIDISPYVNNTWVQVSLTVVASGTGAQIAAHVKNATLRQSP